MMKKLLCLVLALVLSLGALTSCRGEPSAEEKEMLTETFLDLLEKSKQVNDLLFGEGILPKEGGVALGAYTEADPDSLDFYGVTDIPSVKARIREVYSLSISAWIESTLLSSSKDAETGTVLTYARYYTGKTDPANKEEKELFFVNTEHKATVGKVSYSDVSLVECTSTGAKFSLTVTVTHEGEERSFADTLTMTKEEGGWRLDAPSYATYE